MQKIGQQRKLHVLVFLVLLGFIFSNTVVSVSAHEIYYDGSTGINLKWADVTNRTANLKMNGDMLNGHYAANYGVVRNAWPNASPRVSVTDTDFSTSNVDLAVASESAWDNRWGIFSESVLGVCDITSTDGIELTSVANAKASSRRIKYAGILFTPYDVYEGTTHRRFTMIHEIGHALGLGHPNTDYYVTDVASVMRQGTVETYYRPQAHDTTDLNNKY